MPSSAEHQHNTGPASRRRRALLGMAGAVLPSSLFVWHGPRQGRRVALTFDDGPCELTPAYLDVLARFAARATFFVVGEQCREHPELVRQIEAEGHALGSHGYTHAHFPDLVARGLLQGELERTAALLPVGHRRWVRPPYGDLTARSLLACARAGFTTVLWSHDSGDYRTRQADPVRQAVAPETVEAGAIVLLHEGQVWTLDALTSILARLTESGHDLVTIDALFA
jgi:peptidoglycan-N-acetylglucosamine deacetylase